MTIKYKNYYFQQMTQRTADSVLERLERSTDTCLSDVYGRYSAAKGWAFESCLGIARDMDNETPVYIIGHNSNAFSVAFIGNIDGKRTLFYFTSYYHYFRTLE